MLWIRTAVVLLFAILLWNGAQSLSELWFGSEYSPASHLATGIIITVFCCLFIEVSRTRGYLNWKQIGFSTISRNLSSFGLGFILWMIPAAIGLWLCLVMGWVEIAVISDFNQLAGRFIFLILAVFLIEAFPEEIIFRGYIYRMFHERFSHWATVIWQLGLFTLFGYFAGAIYSLEQLMFLPGFAFILGYFRAVTGNVWTTIGFHSAFMTVSQWISPMQHFEVSGLFTLQFVAFILFPSALGAIALGFIYPNHRWGEKAS